MLLRLSAEGAGGPVSVRRGASGKDFSNGGWPSYFCGKAVVPPKVDWQTASDEQLKFVLSKGEMKESKLL